MSRARDFADLAGSADAGGLTGRRLTINGGMQVWQRTTSISGGSLGSFVWAADRFWMYAPSSTSGTVGQSTDVPSGEGFAYSLYNNLDTSCLVGTNVELYVTGSDAPFVNGNQYTISFWVKGGSASTGNGIPVTTRDDSGGTGSVTRASGLAFDVSTSWVRVEKTFTLSGTVGASNKCLQVEFSIPVGGYITGVQLEVGETATPFEHRSYGEELALCQRYYQVYRAKEAYSPALFIGSQRTSTAIGASFTFPKSMRAAPSFTATNSSNAWYIATAGDANANTIVLVAATQDTADLNLTTNTGTAGQAGRVYPALAAGYFDFDAEL